MKMIIGGKKVDALDKATQNVINPATGEVIDTIPRATKEDVEQAIVCAQKGFEEWRKTPMYKRMEILKKFGDKIRENVDELTDYLVKEVGKPYGQSYGEVIGAAEDIDNYIAGAKSLKGEVIMPEIAPGSDGTMFLTKYEPMGIFISIVPFNYPVWEVVLNAVPALLMGNSVILKPCSDTPLSNIRMVELAIEAGMPGNVFQVITGSGGVVGDFLTGDKRIAGVVLTGSVEVGEHVGQLAGGNLKRLFLELGGNDPMVIFDDADLDYAVAQAIDGRIWNTGQVCAAKKRFIVPNKMKEAFLDKLVAELKKYKLGDPTDKEALLGPLVTEKAANLAVSQVNKAIEQGGKLILGGKKLEHAYFELTVIDVPKTADVAQSDEIFAPVWTVIGYDTDEEALEIANNSDCGLNAACIGKDVSRVMHFANNVEAGTCVVNGANTSPNPWQPFGGVKTSGIGRSDAISSLQMVSNLKTINIRNAF